MISVGDEETMCLRRCETYLIKLFVLWWKAAMDLGDVLSFGSWGPGHFFVPVSSCTLFCFWFSILIYLSPHP
jgi:hypothetical protein